MSTGQESDGGASTTDRGDGAQSSAGSQTAGRGSLTGSWRQTFVSFGSRDFFLLWLSMVLVMVGGQMNQMARGLLAYQLTESPRVLGALSVAEAVPILAFSLFGGVIADRLDRKTLVILGQSVTAALALYLAVAITMDFITWIHLLVTAAIQGVSWALTIPARNSIIPGLVGPARLGNAMALIGAGMSSTILIGPALGGLLYGLIGPDGVYFVATGIGVTAVLASALIRRPSAVPEPRTRRVVGEIAEGLVEIWRSRRAFVLLAVALVIGLLTHPLRVFLPALVVDTYNQESEGLGLLIAMMGLGSLVGSLVLATMGNYRRGLILVLTGFLSGVALMLAGGVPVYWIAVIVLLVHGLGETGQRVLTQSLLMESVEDRFRGRVMSLQEMKHGLMFLGALPAGFVAEAVGVESTVVVLGAATIVASALVLASQRDLRGVW